MCTSSKVLHVTGLTNVSTFRILTHGRRLSRHFLETKAEYLEESEAKRMKRIAPGYTLTNSVLYKKGFSTLFLRCVTRLVMTTIPRELHEGYTAKGINGESLYTVTIEINCHSISIVDSSQ